MAEEESEGWAPVVVVFLLLLLVILATILLSRLLLSAMGGSEVVVFMTRREGEELRRVEVEERGTGSIEDWQGVFYPRIPCTHCSGCQANTGYC